MLRQRCSDQVLAEIFLEVCLYHPRCRGTCSSHGCHSILAVLMSSSGKRADDFRHPDPDPRPVRKVSRWEFGDTEDDCLREVCREEQKRRLSPVRHVNSIFHLGCAAQRRDHFLDRHIQDVVNNRSLRKLLESQIQKCCNTEVRALKATSQEDTTEAEFAQSVTLHWSVCAKRNSVILIRIATKKARSGCVGLEALRKRIPALAAVHRKRRWLSMLHRDHGGTLRPNTPINDSVSSVLSSTQPTL